MIPPKISVSDYVGTVKGKAAIMIFKNYPRLKIKPYWGNHFWAKGYCVDTVGLGSRNNSQIRDISREARENGKVKITNNLGKQFTMS